MRKIIFTAFLLILTFQKAFSDCGHCFHLIKVNLSYTNGDNEIGYLKFYDEYSIQNNNTRPKLNTSIKHFFVKQIDSIEIISKYYKVKDLPEFIDTNDKRSVTLNKISDIYLISWMNITGSFNMPILDEESISKIINATDIVSEIKIFDVHDEIYVKTNPSISASDFKTFIKKTYNNSDLNNSIINGLKINKRKNIYPTKTDIINRVNDYLKSLEDTINSISTININKNINSYFLSYKTNLEKRKNYANSILDYLNSNKPHKIHSFIESNVSNKNIKKRMLDELSKDLSIIEKTLNLCSFQYEINENHLFMDLFYKTLKKEDIIVIVNSWD